MAVTQDAESITNSVMMAIDKELRKIGIAPAGHRHYDGNRKIIKGLIDMMILDQKEQDDAEAQGS